MVNQKEERKTVEKRWREEKYKVMYYNQNHYNYIRQLMKNPDADLLLLNNEIAKAYTNEPSAGSMLNAFQHMWGYFKKKATSDEKEHFLQLAEDVEENNEKIIRFLYDLAVKYEVTYLQESSILKTAFS